MVQYNYVRFVMHILLMGMYAIACIVYANSMLVYASSIQVANTWRGVQLEPKFFESYVLNIFSEKKKKSDGDTSNWKNTIY